MIKLERRSDHIKIVESDSTRLSRSSGHQCSNCKERYQLIILPTDLNNLFCSNCGHTTPVRTVKHGRGLAAPSIQQPTAIIQSKNPTSAKDRKPQGINRGKKKDPIEQQLINQGFQVIDVQTIEPRP